MKFLKSRVFHWTKKGSIAILDQVLFNGMHFLIAILLARWLDPVQYGIFAITYSVLLFFGAFHMAILIEPMLIFGSSKYKGVLKKYLGVLFYGNFLLTITAGIFLVIAGALIWFFYSKGMCLVLFGLAVSMPFILLLWLLRRAFYVNLEPIWPTVGGVGYFVLLSLTVYLLHLKNWLSPVTYFLSMGLCSLLVSLFFIHLLRPSLAVTFKQDVISICKDHLHYGRWAFGTNALTWCMNNVYFVILPFLIGLKGVAALRALMNLSTPIIQTSSALSFLLLPILGRHRFEGIDKMKNTVRLSLALSVIAAVAYTSVLMCFGKNIMEFLYGNRYSEFSQLIHWVALLPLGTGITIVLENTLRTLGRPDKVFWSYFLSTVIALIGVMPLAHYFGLKGVLYGYNLSYLVTVLIMIFLLRRSQVKL